MDRLAEPHTRARGAAPLVADDAPQVAWAPQAAARLVRRRPDTEELQAAPEASLPAGPTSVELKSFVDRLMQGDEPGANALVRQLRLRGLSVETLYLDLLAPAARALGALWDQDLCDFPGVTVGAGRLQKMLRELSLEFEVEGSARTGAVRHARRVLLAQPPQEQHSLGLSMVATFFRRDGWLVEGGVGTATVDPAVRAQADWFDVVGFSCGSQTRLNWMHEKIASVRLVSRNPAVVVLVGGPLFALHPEWVERVGANAAVADARDAPGLANRMVNAWVEHG